MESTSPTLKQDAQQVLEKLSNTTAKTLMSNGLQDWAALGDKLSFSTALPEQPVAPPAPQEPAVAELPREDDPKYSVELTTLDKLLASRRIKKQDAALKRFEKDRKAWNEDRDYARGIYERAKKKHLEEIEGSAVTYEAALDQWKRDFEAYLKTLAHRAA